MEPPAFSACSIVASFVKSKIKYKVIWNEKFENVSIAADFISPGLYSPKSLKSQSL